MKALELAIVNGEEERLKALLTNLLSDEIQKSDLINVAKHSGNSEIERLLNGAPTTP